MGRVQGKIPASPIEGRFWYSRSCCKSGLVPNGSASFNWTRCRFVMRFAKILCWIVQLKIKMQAGELFMAKIELLGFVAFCGKSPKIWIELKFWKKHLLGKMYDAKYKALHIFFGIAKYLPMQWLVHGFKPMVFLVLCVGCRLLRKQYAIVETARLFLGLPY